MYPWVRYKVISNHNPFYDAWYLPTRSTYVVSLPGTNMTPTKLIHCCTSWRCNWFGLPAGLIIPIGSGCHERARAPASSHFKPTSAEKQRRRTKKRNGIQCDLDWLINWQEGRFLLPWLGVKNTLNRRKAVSQSYCQVAENEKLIAIRFNIIFH